MKGTEGIDYVITECSHCKGSGKCKCYNCYYDAALTIVVSRGGTNYGVDKKIKDFENEGFEVKCTVCKGVGKVVFWRE